MRAPALEAAPRQRVAERLGRWLEGWIRRELGVLLRLREAAERGGLSGAGRAVAYRLAEGQGVVGREEADGLVRDLTAADRKLLARLGVRLGLCHLFVPDLLKPAACVARARLLRVFLGRPVAPAPPGRTVLRAPWPAPPDRLLSIGFAAFDGFALRVDMLERVAAAVRARARDAASFSVPAAMAAEAGLSREELGVLVPALGYRLAPPGDGTTYPRLAGRRPRPAPRRTPPAHSPFAVLAALRS